MSEITPEERLRRAQQRAAARREEKGRREEATKKFFARYWWVAVLGVLAVIGVLGEVSKPPLTAEQKALRAEYWRRVDAMGACENLIQKNLRDPGSYELVSRSWLMDGPLISYRAKNGFGGYVKGNKHCLVEEDTVQFR